ncbi:MAG: BatA domain-containing protein [bacterium]
MLTFLTPLFLAGLAAAAIPLLIHLTRSRRVKKITFSSTQFFGEDFLRSRRMSRVKEWLLLLARMALFAILALALARPVLLPQNRAAHGGRRAIVIVLDDSASMSYRDGNGSLFDRARSAAHALLDSLRPGDRAALVLAGRRADGPLTPVSTPGNPEVVRRALDATAFATLGTDLAGAVARAEQIVAAGAADSREIHILSDLQDSGWDTATPFPAARGGDVLYQFAQVRPVHAENAGIVALQYANALPMVGLPYAIRPLIRCAGAAPGGIEVSLFVDGEKVTQRRLMPDVRSGTLAPVFLHTFTTPGWHSGWVELSPDNLDADNRRWFAFEVRAALPVLAVNGAPSAVRRLDELFYMRAALDAGGTNRGVRLDSLRPEALGSARLEDYPVAILANVAQLDEAVVQRLEGWVDSGGSLLVFAGDRVQGAWYADRLSGAARLHGGLLPARLLEVAGHPGADATTASIGACDIGHPALAPFDDPRFASLGGVTFTAFWRVEPAPDASILMRTDSGLPLCLEKPFGRGRVMLFAAPCDRDWSNFPVRAAYVPWIQRLVAYLAQDRIAAQPFFATGARIPIPAAAGAALPEIHVRKPDGTPAGVLPGSIADSTPLVVADTVQPGVYILSLSSPPPQPAASAYRPPPSVALCAVNLEGCESNLRYLDEVFAGSQHSASLEKSVEKGLQELLPGRPLVSFVAEATQAAGAALRARQGRRLWDVLLIIVLAIALIEPWLANRVFARHYAAPAPGKEPA